MAKNTFINQAEISHYLKDVRKRKVLTPAREKELAKIMLTEGYAPRSYRKNSFRTSRR